MKPAPASRVIHWVGEQPAASLYTTSITQAEVLHGILLLASGRRRAALEAAALSMFAEDFAGRVLGFGGDAAPLFARIASDRRRAGRPISGFGAQIAAIARSTGGVLATRNVADFEECGLTLVDPWRS
jgi:predicted nucleic acid-binding protein